MNVDGFAKYDDDDEDDSATERVCGHPGASQQEARVSHLPGATSHTNLPAGHAGINPTEIV